MPFPKRIGPTVLTASNATFFTATVPLILSSLTFVNTDASIRTVRVNLVERGGAVAVGNRIVADLSILPNDTAKVALEVVMNPGDTLQGLASLTSVVNVIGTYGDEKKVLRGS